MDSPADRPDLAPDQAGTRALSHRHPLRATTFGDWPQAAGAGSDDGCGPRVGCSVQGPPLSGQRERARRNPWVRSASRPPKISWSGQSPDLHSACPQGSASASFQSLMNPLATTPCTTNGSLSGELLSGAADVTANDKGFLAPLWAFSGRRSTSACDRALRERCISYLWPCTGF